MRDCHSHCYDHVIITTNTNYNKWITQNKFTQTIKTKKTNNNIWFTAIQRKAKQLNWIELDASSNKNALNAIPNMIALNCIGFEWFINWDINTDDDDDEGIKIFSNIIKTIIIHVIKDIHYFYYELLY